MALSARISAEKLAAKVGSTIEVLIDRVDELPSPPSGGAPGSAPSNGWCDPDAGDSPTESGERGHFDGHLDAPHPEHASSPGATGRSKADAPEIDGEVHLRDAGGLKPGDIVSVRVEDSDEHDLYGVPA
jgi:ribosomal protein S12 methylthiotransferase